MLRIISFNLILLVMVSAGGTPTISAPLVATAKKGKVTLIQSGHIRNCQGEARIAIHGSQPGTIPFRLECGKGRSFGGVVKISPSNLLGVKVFRFQVNNNERVICALRARTGLKMGPLSGNNKVFKCTGSGIECKGGRVGYAATRAGAPRGKPRCTCPKGKEARKTGDKNYQCVSKNSAKAYKNSKTIRSNRALPSNKIKKAGKSNFLEKVQKEKTSKPASKGKAIPRYVCLKQKIRTHRRTNAPTKQQAQFGARQRWKAAVTAIAAFKTRRVTNSWQIARDRNYDCSKITHFGGWSCHAIARPCGKE